MDWLVVRTGLVPDSALCSPRRQHLLVHTARSEGYSKLMLGDSCTRLAVKLLSSISLGRGAQLAQDTVRMSRGSERRARGRPEEF